MAVAIRMKRYGTTKKPMYRVVVADKRSPRDGGCIEEIGIYQPRVEPAVLKVDMDRLNKWVSQGAQVSAAVKNLIKKHAAK